MANHRRFIIEGAPGRWRAWTDLHNEEGDWVEDDGFIATAPSLEGAIEEGRCLLRC